MIVLNIMFVSAHHAYAWYLDFFYHSLPEFVRPSHFHDEKQLLKVQRGRVSKTHFISTLKMSPYIYLDFSARSLIVFELLSHSHDEQRLLKVKRIE